MIVQAHGSTAGERAQHEEEIIASAQSTTEAYFLVGVDDRRAIAILELAIGAPLLPARSDHK